MVGQEEGGVQCLRAAQLTAYKSCATQVLPVNIKDSCSVTDYVRLNIMIKVFMGREKYWMACDKSSVIKK